MYIFRILPITHNYFNMTKSIFIVLLLITTNFSAFSQINVKAVKNLVGASKSKEPKAPSRKGDYTQSQGITSPVHEKYVKKIVFSNTEIAEGNPDESSFLKTYTISDKLIYRIFLDNSITNTLYKHEDITESDVKYPKVLYKFYLNGELIFTEVQDKLKELQTRTTWEGNMFTHKDKNTWEDIEEGTFRKLLIRFEEKLSASSNTLKIEAYAVAWNGGYRDLIAEGELTLVNKPESFKNLLKYQQFTFPKPGTLSTKEMEKQILDQMIKNQPASYNHIKVVITSDDWSIERHPVSGVITHRTLDAAIIYMKDQKCYFIYGLMGQEYNGTGYQTQFKYLKSSEEQQILLQSVK